MHWQITYLEIVPNITSISFITFLYDSFTLQLQEANVTKLKSIRYEEILLRNKLEIHVALNDRKQADLGQEWLQTIFLMQIITLEQIKLLYSHEFSNSFLQDSVGNLSSQVS